MKTRNTKSILAIERMNRLGKERTPFFFMIDYAMEHPVVYDVGELGNQPILFDVNGIRNYPYKKFEKKKVKLKKKPISFEKWEKGFNDALSNINFGNSYLLNYTANSPIDINLSLEEIFYRSNAKYKLLYGDQFVVFSPEIFIQIKNGVISSFPMKGTIDASLKDAEKVLLDNKKEMAEHATIVDLIRNDMSIYAKKVRVEKFRYVDELKTSDKNLLQISSKISGALNADYYEKLGTILFSMLPAGSVTGAPKKKTVEIINSIESYDRGYYTGVFGFFDGQNLDCGVMIRFIEKDGKQLYFKSGGGLTFQSDARTEYQELIDKIYVPII